MRNKISFIVFLLQTVLVMVSDRSDRPRWPKVTDVNEWPVNLDLQKETPSKRLKWPARKYVSSHINRSVYEPFADSQEDMTIGKSESCEQLCESKTGIGASSCVVSPAASSVDSFFDYDWTNVKSSRDPVELLIEEEEQERKSLEVMENSEFANLRDGNELMTCLYEERVDYLQRTIQYMEQLKYVYFLFMRERNQRFTIMYARTGSLKFWGLHREIEENLINLLNGSDFRFSLLEDLVYGYSIDQRYVDLIKRMLNP